MGMAKGNILWLQYDNHLNKLPVLQYFCSKLLNMEVYSNEQMNLQYEFIISLLDKETHLKREFLRF
jgi:hypothetical protein